jgi:hypothetical protein
VQRAAPHGRISARAPPSPATAGAARADARHLSRATQPRGYIRGMPQSRSRRVLAGLAYLVAAAIWVGLAIWGPSKGTPVFGLAAVGSLTLAILKLRSTRL